MIRPISEIVCRDVEIFQSREAFESDTGTKCPEYTAQLPVKRWSVKDGSTELFQERWFLAVHADGSPKLSANGAPYLERLSLPVMILRGVNIPSGASNQPGAGAPELQAPLDPTLMKTGETLIMVPSGAKPFVAIWDGKDDPRQGSGGGFTAEDRELLRRIAAKVGA